MQSTAAASAPPNNIELVTAQGAYPLEDTAMTLTASLTLCQYCEHANPADAKFCAGCGAPLHLIPCPHCGAVNQKTSKTCYQCHGELRESTEILLASTPANASEEAANDAESTALPSPYAPQPPPRQRQPVFVVVIIFMAFAAAAYFAYQQRGTVDGKASPADATTAADKTPDTSAANASAGAISKALPASTPPAVAPTPLPLPADAGKTVPSDQVAPLVALKNSKVDDTREAAAPANPVNRASAGRSRSGISRRDAQAAPAVSTEVFTPASGRIEKKSPQTVPCTEAIAALGLCTPVPTKGKE